VPPHPDQSVVIWTENRILPGGRHEQSDREAARRRAIVAAVRSGRSQHEVAHEFGVSQSTVHAWVRRAQGQRLDRVDWHDHPCTPHTTTRTEATIEDLVLTVRTELGQRSDLGFHGAEAIHEALQDRKVEPLPSVRTINRILERRGALDGQRRIRRPPPPPGWHLPEVASKRRELDSFDVVEGLVIKGGPQIEVLNGISLHGGLPVSWPMEASVTAKVVVASLIAHWQACGLPGYAQFDNDTTFQGPHTHPDVVGRVSRLCLSLGVVPVFVVPHEFGFQSTIENSNGTWQEKVWARFEHGSLLDLQGRSRRYVTALRRHRTDRIESAPRRRAFPKRWRLDLQSRPRGRIIYLRRTSAVGAVEALGRSFDVDPHWLNRLVRVEVDLDGDKIRIYRLRRREPQDQPLLRELHHHIRNRKFLE
jgi:transposase-like protein